jgi:hypothetical protein
LLRHTLLKNGNREGTIETFKKIAAALRVDIDDIAQENRETVMSTLGRRLIQAAKESRSDRAWQGRPRNHR